MTIKDIGENHMMDNLCKRFLCYRVIVRDKLGELGKGERRQIGACCENMVRCAFPNDIGEA